MTTTRKLRTILCPIDFDVNSLAALDMARDLARDNGAILYMLHVVIPPYPLLISPPFLAHRERQYAAMRLDEIARDALRDVNHSVVLKTGEPAGQIINTAAEIEADLLIMATHGRTDVPRFFLGSVAEKVVRESPCPVLTVRGMAAYDREQPRVTSGTTAA
jgi:nucleotide-binding universal stress UspA family protein